MSITKEQALELVRCLAEDFALLASGEWVPDDDSCAASLETVERLRTFIESVQVPTHLQSARWRRRYDADKVGAL